VPRRVVFDLGDVLLRLDVPRGFRALATLADATPDATREFMAAGLFRDLNLGRCDGVGFIAAFNTRFGTHIAEPELRAAWERFIAGPNAAMVALLNELVARDAARGAAARDAAARDDAATPRAAAHGPAVAVLSNTDRWHYEACVRLVPALARVPAVLSCDAGAMKPDAAIYRALLARLTAEPGDCLFIDDRPENVVAARVLGFAGAVFDGDAEAVRARCEGFLAGA